MGKGLYTYRGYQFLSDDRREELLEFILDYTGPYLDHDRFVVQNYLLISGLVADALLQARAAFWFMHAHLEDVVLGDCTLHSLFEETAGFAGISLSKTKSVYASTFDGRCLRDILHKKRLFNASSTSGVK